MPPSGNAIFFALQGVGGSSKPEASSQAMMISLQAYNFPTETDAAELCADVREDEAEQEDDPGLSFHQWAGLAAPQKCET